MVMVFGDSSGLSVNYYYHGVNDFSFISGMRVKVVFSWLWWLVAIPTTAQIQSPFAQGLRSGRPRWDKISEGFYFYTVKTNGRTISGKLVKM